MASFFIIVPTLNSAAFLDCCLGSIFAQPGAAAVHVHVQDDQSTDRTLAIVEEWEGKFSAGARRLSFASEPDRGLFDALTRAAALAETAHIMTWLGSDDVLMPGTLATVASIFDQLSEVCWLTGLPFVSNEAGESYTPWPPAPYVRSEIAAGLYDGRTRGFIMQEGTFWRVDLWRQVGGIDTRFKRAGEWDLWRRFAQHAPLYAVTFPFARFSRRAGQKSEDLAAYYREIDGSPALPPVEDHSSYQLTRRPWTVEWCVTRQEHRPVSDSCSAPDASPAQFC